MNNLWHVAAPDGKLTHGDNRAILVRHTLWVNGVPKISKFGLHASQYIDTALTFQPQGIICLVELNGIIDDDQIKRSDKLYAAEGRTVIASFGLNGSKELVDTLKNNIVFNRLRHIGGIENDILDVYFERLGMLTLFNMSVDHLPLRESVSNYLLTDRGRRIFWRFTGDRRVELLLHRCWSLCVHGMTTRDTLTDGERVIANNLALSHASTIKQGYGEPI